MKTKKLFFFAAMLLMSVCGFAQSGGGDPITGDVNEDGVVDVGDIVAVIDIIQSNTPITYYWYVGQTNPSSMSNISPIVSDMSSPGWRLIGNTLPTYSSSNMLWSADNVITTGSSLAKQYIAIPANSSACPRDGLGNDASTVDMYNKLSNVTISGVEYKVYETVGKSRKYGLDTY